MTILKVINKKGIISEFNGGSHVPFCSVINFFKYSISEFNKGISRPLLSRALWLVTG